MKFDKMLNDYLTVIVSYLELLPSNNNNIMSNNDNNIMLYFMLQGFQMRKWIVMSSSQTFQIRSVDESRDVLELCLSNKDFINGRKYARK